jgi:GGDEF domain-containing protein
VIPSRLAAALSAFNAERAGDHELSASCGVAIWPACSDEALDTFIKQADEAMYLAKRASQIRISPQGGTWSEEGFED